MNTIPEFFGSLVFDDRVMKSRLPSGVYNSLRKTIAEGAKGFLIGGSSAESGQPRR